MGSSSQLLICRGGLRRRVLTDRVVQNFRIARIATFHKGVSRGGGPSGEDRASWVSGSSVTTSSLKGKRRKQFLGTGRNSW